MPMPAEPPVTIECLQSNMERNVTTRNFTHCCKAHEYNICVSSRLAAADSLLEVSTLTPKAWQILPGISKRAKEHTQWTALPPKTGHRSTKGLGHRTTDRLQSRPKLPSQKVIWRKDVSMATHTIRIDRRKQLHEE